MRLGTGGLLTGRSDCAERLGKATGQTTTQRDRLAYELEALTRRQATLQLSLRVYDPALGFVRFSSERRQVKACVAYEQLRHKSLQSVQVTKSLGRCTFDSWLAVWVLATLHSQRHRRRRRRRCLGRRQRCRRCNHRLRSQIVRIMMAYTQCVKCSCRLLLTQATTIGLFTLYKLDLAKQRKTQTYLAPTYVFVKSQSQPLRSASQRVHLRSKYWNCAHTQRTHSHSSNVHQLNNCNDA